MIAITSAVASSVRYLTLATVVMTGCTFASPAPTLEVIPPAPEPPAPQPCLTNEQGVALCVDFEDRPLVDQASDRSPNQTNAAAVDVNTTERRPGEQAAVLRSTSSLRVRETASLDLPRFTIEMWIFPEQPPAKRTDVGLFDNFGQYTMRLRDDLRIRCGLTATSDILSNSAVPRQAWSHVACSYADGELRIYLNGQLSDCRTVTPISLVGTFGSAIGAELKPNVGATAVAPGDRFLGGIDNVRIYDHAVEAEHICAAAGQAPGSCLDACPDDGTGE
jgi:hypothetical protein